MKTAFGLLGFAGIIAALLYTACAADNKRLPPAADAVCGIEVNESKAEAAGLTSVWKESTYYFCSADCKKQFDRMPMMYHAKCPVCNLTVQKTAALAAEHSDRTYYFDSAEHRSMFIKDPAKYTGELATDVVCGMEVIKAKAEQAGLTAGYGGKTYYFCGPGCKEKFLKAPDDFTGERTAICPVCGMTVVRMQAQTEGLVSAYQKKSYYFCCSGCRSYFDRNPEKYLRLKE